jgi:hypothetical protein
MSIKNRRAPKPGELVWSDYEPLGALKSRYVSYTWGKIRKKGNLGMLLWIVKSDWKHASPVCAILINGKVVKTLLDTVRRVLPSDT